MSASHPGMTEQDNSPDGGKRGRRLRMNTRYAGLIPFPIMVGILIYFMISFYPETSRLPKSLIFNPPFPYSSAHTFFMFFSTIVVADLFDVASSRAEPST